MTSIFKNYRALITLTKNLEKLGVDKEIVSKAIIQSIGEMDSMMGKFLISSEKETPRNDPNTSKTIKKPPQVVEDESEEEDSAEVEVEEDEGEDVMIREKCAFCGKKDGAYPHYSSNGRVVECPFANYSPGRYCWLVKDLYLFGDWLIFANPSFSLLTVGKKATTGTTRVTFHIKSLEFETCRGYEQSSPYRSIFVLDFKEMQQISTKAEETYNYLRHLKLLHYLI